MAKITLMLVGTEESSVLPSLLKLDNIKIDIICNNILDFELPPLVENAAPIWHRHELRNALRQIGPEKFEISTSLKNLLQENDRLDLDEQYLGVTSHISQIEQNSKDLFVAYSLLLEQTGNSNLNLFPLVKSSEQLIALKNKKLAPLRYYHLEQKLLDLPVPNSIDKKKLKDKDLNITGLEHLKSLKLSEPAAKSMQDSDLICIVPTDKVSLSVLVASDDLEKQLKNMQSPLVLVWPFDESDEDDANEVELEITKYLGFGWDIDSFATDLSFLTDYIIVKKSEKALMSKLREVGCHVLISDFDDNNNELDEGLLNTILKVADLDVTVKTKILDELSDLNGDDSENEEEEQENVEEENTPSEDNGEDESEDVVISNGSEIEEDQIVGKPISQLTESPEEAGIERSANLPKVEKTDAVNNILDDLSQREQAIDEEGRQLPSNQNHQEKLNEEANPINEQITPSNATTGSVELPTDRQKFSVRAEEDWIDTVKRAIEQAFEENNDLALDWLIEQSGNDSDREMQIGEIAITAWIDARSTPDRRRGAEILSTLSKNNRETYVQILQRHMIMAVKENQEDKRRILVPLFTIIRDVDLALSETLIRGITNDLASLDEDEEISVKETAKLTILQLVIQSRRLSRIAIQELLTLLDTKSNIGPEIWNILLAFDAGSISLELVTNFSVAKADEIIRKSSLLRFTGSYYATITRVMKAWKDGDKAAISSATGSILPEETLRKFERLELARKVDKLKMVQLSTLAESLGRDVETVERLITELIVNDELKAEMKLIDEKMYLVSSSTQVQS